MGLLSAKIGSSNVCFNRAKSSQLGQHGDAQLALNAEEIHDAIYELASIVEHNVIKVTYHHVIIKIKKFLDNFEYLINFHRKPFGIADIMEGYNNMLVTRIPLYSVYKDSRLINRLDEGKEHAMRVLKGQKVISTNDQFIAIYSFPEYTSVRISKHPKCLSDSNYNTYDSYATSKCINYDCCRQEACSRK